MADTQFASIDEQKMSAFHWRTMLTTGLGVFCDGYDISAIALVLGPALKSFGEHQVASVAGATLASSALVGSMVGAIIFGVLGQWGRKRFYGLDVLILGVAAIAQAFVPNLTWLIIWRFILGLGVGADYVLSPVIMAEHANRKDRGKMLGLGFATMWGLGALAAAAVKLLLDTFSVPEDLVWKLVLAGGAIPALGVMYFRRTMPETARYLARIAKHDDKARGVMEEIAGRPVEAPPGDTRPFLKVLAQHAGPIFAGAFLWFIYDLVVYAAILFGPNIIAQRLGLGPATYTILTQLLFYLPAAVLMSWFVIDGLGRKPLQVWGFLLSAVVLVAFAQMSGTAGFSPLIAFVTFGLFNMAQTGPGLVSGGGIYGVELAPTRVRTFAQAITVIGGRLGASITGFLFPLITKYANLSTTIYVLAGVCLAGGVFTQLLVPETGKRSLEDINAEPGHEPASKAAT